MQVPSRYRENLNPKTLYHTLCQNNSVIGKLMKRLCTYLISMVFSRSNKLRNKAAVKI